MKKLFIIFILPLFLSACSTPQPAPPAKAILTGLTGNECHQQKAILESFLIKTNSVEVSAFLEEDMVREVIRPLFPQFDIDSEQCSGYTAAMRDEAEGLILSRRAEFRSYLIRICSLPHDDEKQDASGMSYSGEQYAASVAALKYLNASTDECYKKSPGI